MPRSLNKAERGSERAPCGQTVFSTQPEITRTSFNPVARYMLHWLCTAAERWTNKLPLPCWMGERPGVAMTFLVKFSDSNGSHMGGVHEAPLASRRFGGWSTPHLLFVETKHLLCFLPTRTRGWNKSSSDPATPLLLQQAAGGPPKPGTAVSQTGAFPFAFYLVALWGFAASFFASYRPETLPVKPQSHIKKKWGWARRQLLLTDVPVSIARNQPI